MFWHKAILKCDGLKATDRESTCVLCLFDCCLRFCNTNEPFFVLSFDESTIWWQRVVETPFINTPTPQLFAMVLEQMATEQRSVRELFAAQVRLSKITEQLAILEFMEAILPNQLSTSLLVFFL